MCHEIKRILPESIRVTVGTSENGTFLNLAFMRDPRHLTGNGTHLGQEVLGELLSYGGGLGRGGAKRLKFANSQSDGLTGENSAAIFGLAGRAHRGADPAALHPDMEIIYGCHPLPALSSRSRQRDSARCAI